MNPHYRIATSMPSPMGLPESNFVYFYHPDHLGSTSFVTDGGGEVYEHVQYLPHGEIWADERSNTERLPYLFTGKELDQETGLYDFGARMYDPRIALWASPDPALPEFITGASGCDPALLAVFGYVVNNPLRLVDPDGRQPRINGNNEDGPVAVATGTYGGQSGVEVTFGDEFEPAAGGGGQGNSSLPGWLADDVDSGGGRFSLLDEAVTLASVFTLDFLGDDTTGGRSGGIPGGMSPDSDLPGWLSQTTYLLSNVGGAAVDAGLSAVRRGRQVLKNYQLGMDFEEMVANNIRSLGYIVERSRAETRFTLFGRVRYSDMLAWAST